MFFEITGFGSLMPKVEDYDAPPFVASHRYLYEEGLEEITALSLAPEWEYRGTEAELGRVARPVYRGAPIPFELPAIVPDAPQKSRPTARPSRRFSVPEELHPRISLMYKARALIRCGKCPKSAVLTKTGCVITIHLRTQQVHLNMCFDTEEQMLAEVADGQKQLYEVMWNEQRARRKDRLQEIVR